MSPRTTKTEELEADDVLNDLCDRGSKMGLIEFADFCEELSDLLDSQADAARADEKRSSGVSDDDEEETGNPVDFGDIDDE